MEPQIIENFSDKMLAMSKAVYLYVQENYNNLDLDKLEEAVTDMSYFIQRERLKRDKKNKNKN